MAKPPSNRTLVLSIVGTIACLMVLYWAIRMGEASHPRPAPGAAPASTR